MSIDLATPEADACVRSGDTPPVEVFNGSGRAHALVLCDHAGNHIPARLGRLGVPDAEIGRHIGWDVGAADVARTVARLLDAPAVLCHVSRLVIDPNRVPGHPTSILPVSDGTPVPGNREVGIEECRRRMQGSFLPYHRTIARRIGGFRRRGIFPVIVAIHSFTPSLGGHDRPWHIGILWDRDDRLSAPVLHALRAQEHLVIGDNQPYSGRADFGFTVAFHAQRTRLPHIMFEIRQDFIDTAEKARPYGELIADVLREPLDDPDLYALFSESVVRGPSPWRRSPRH